MNRARKWWGGLTPTGQAILRWFLPLLAAGIVVQVDWFYRQSQGVATPQTGRDLLKRVGFVFVYAVVVKLVFTRGWSVEAIGVTLAILGVAGVFLRVIGRWGPQPVSEAEKDYLQSLLDVGAIVLAIGVTIYAVLRLLRRDNDAPPPAIERDEVTGVIHPAAKVYDRRKGPRRHGWGRRKEDRQP